MKISAEERLAQLKENAKQNSRRFYEKKFKITDDMTDDKKKEIQKNIEKRKLILKDKYNNNKEERRAKQKAYRDRRKATLTNNLEEQKHIVSFD